MNLGMGDLAAAGRASGETGIPLDTLLSNLHARAREVREKVISKEGKFTVLGVDRFDGEDFIEGRYDTAEKALEVARSKTEEGKQYASDASVATVYYAYDPHGNYLGGDAWTE